MPAETINAGSYLDETRKALLKSMCLQHFSSQQVERHSKPEIEIPSCRFSVFPSEKIVKSAKEDVLIEKSINSVRISIKIKKMDELDALLCHKFASFLTQRAESFVILRKKPIKDYDVSFLVTDHHLKLFLKENIADFIITFMQEVDKEISEMKIGINARARGVAECFFRSIS